MVAYCAAFNCTNGQDMTSGIPYHSFPFKRPEICKLWVHAVRRKNFTPTRCSRLCGQHFKLSDYVIKPSLPLNILKPDAVPSIFDYSVDSSQKRSKISKILKPESEVDVNLTSELAERLKKNEENQIEPVNIYNQDSEIFILKVEPMDEEVNTDSEPAPTISRETVVDVDSQTIQLGNSTDMLRRQVKTLRRKLKRKEAKIANLKCLIRELTARGCGRKMLRPGSKNPFSDVRDEDENENEEMILQKS